MRGSQDPTPVPVTPAHRSCLVSAEIVVENFIEQLNAKVGNWLAPPLQKHLAASGPSALYTLSASDPLHQFRVAFIFPAWGVLGIFYQSL